MAVAGGVRPICQFCQGDRLVPAPATPVQYLIAGQQVWLHPQCRGDYIKSQTKAASKAADDGE